MTQTINQSIDLLTIIYHNPTYDFTPQQKRAIADGIEALKCIKDGHFILPMKGAVITDERP